MSVSTPRPGPVLFCSDGSDGSRAALATPPTCWCRATAVALTVWETVAMRLMAGGLNAGLGGTYVVDEGDLDKREEATAREAAEQGRARPGARLGATARTEQAEAAVWLTIIQTADELDASLIVCGARGLNPIKRAILGSVSEAVLHHSHRPTLISPQPATQLGRGAGETHRRRRPGRALVDLDVEVPPGGHARAVRTPLEAAVAGREYRMQLDRDGLAGTQLGRRRAAVKRGHARMVNLVVLVDKHPRRATE